VQPKNLHSHNFSSMLVEPYSEAWWNLLVSYRSHCNIELEKHVLKNLLKLDLENIGIYVLLANIYISIGRWENVRKVRVMLKEKGLKIILGCCWIEIK
jgi:hypothetical protein